eukprot:GILK01007653.1.p1 GENE.GILK01007653.1~~GILK01007653.1.p1  ORF type:complete len:792 (+),score=101.49 GILK01007653.1:44-2377(+)
MAVIQSRQWEASAPLTADQQDSLTALSQLLGSRSMPDLPSFAAFAVPLSQVKSMPTCAEIWERLHSAVISIEDEQQETSWRDLLDAARNCQNACTNLRDDIDKALNMLTDLDADRKNVMSKNSTLHEACEGIVAEQSRLNRMIDSLHHKLQYFDYLEIVQRQLSGSMSVVLDEHFVVVLTRVEESIHFLSTHPQYKDSESYLNRFVQLQRKALQMVKTFVIQTLRTVTVAVQQQARENRLAGAVVDNTNLFYVKFRASASSIKRLTEELEKRVSINTDFANTLWECQECYYQERLSLLSNPMKENFALIASNNDLSTALRSSCSYLLSVCHQEFQLFHAFFPTSSANEGLWGLMEGLGAGLYDNIHPLVIQQTEVDALCELVEVLRTEVIEEQLETKGETLSALYSLFHRLLQDVQERLIYRTQIYIRDNIDGFLPEPEHLNYPSRLQPLAQIVPLPSTVATDSNNSTSTEISLPSTSRAENLRNLYDTWYPTLERTLLVLSKIYRRLETSIFEGLAQEAVSVCTRSLLSASESITTSQSPTDGQLFLIKHLLIFREQITPFDISFTVRETAFDFNPTKAAVMRILRGEGFRMTDNQSVLHFVQETAPKLVESQLDSKKDLERELKRACESFILTSTRNVVDPFLSFLTKAGSVASSSSTALINAGAFAEPGRVQELVDRVESAVQQGVPELVNKMALYLTNPVTQGILLKPIKANIVDAYRQMHELISREYEGAVRIRNAHQVQADLDSFAVSTPQGSPVSSSRRLESDTTNMTVQ